MEVTPSTGTPVNAPPVNSGASLSFFTKLAGSPDGVSAVISQQLASYQSA